MRPSIIMLAAAIQLAACTPSNPADSLPPVAAENCEPEAIAKITDQKARNQFEDLCVRRYSFRPSPPRGW